MLVNKTNIRARSLNRADQKRVEITINSDILGK
jgi:hypothetical protein